MFSSIRAAIEDLLRFLGGDPGNWVLQQTVPGSILTQLQPHRLPGVIDESA
jgi:hypothetical protein